jgi:ankyrin repeat protein
MNQLEAAERGDLHRLKEALEGKDVNARDANGVTCLHWSCWMGHVHVTEYLTQLYFVKLDKELSSIPEYATEDVSRRNACRGASYVIASLRRRGSSLIGANGRDVLSILAKTIWVSRKDEKWSK